MTTAHQGTFHPQDGVLVISTVGEDDDDEPGPGGGDGSGGDTEGMTSSINDMDTTTPPMTSLGGELPEPPPPPPPSTLLVVSVLDDDDGNDEELEGVVPPLFPPQIAGDVRNPGLLALRGGGGDRAESPASPTGRHFREQDARCVCVGTLPPERKRKAVLEGHR